MQKEHLRKTRREGRRGKRRKKEEKERGWVEEKKKYMYAR